MRYRVVGDISTKEGAEMMIREFAKSHSVVGHSFADPRSLAHSLLSSTP